MIRIKVFKVSQLLYYLFIIILIIAIIFFAYRLFIRQPVGVDDIKSWNSIKAMIEDSSYRSALKKGYTALKPTGKSHNAGLFARIREWVCKYDIRNPKNILAYQIPFVSTAKAEEKDTSVVEVVSRGDNFDRSNIDIEGLDFFPGEGFDDEQDGVMINELDIPEEIKIEIAGIKDELPPIDISGKGPQVLVYSSHSRESYYGSASIATVRSNDANKTVVKVAETLSRHLQAKGIPVLHDGTEHEQNDFNKSYNKSLETIKSRIAEYGSLKVFIDIHRNAYGEGVKKNPDDEVVIIDGQRVAKVMLVIGRGEGSVGGFIEKPNWKENAKLANSITNKINEKYPGLAKPVLYKNGRFNQHISTKSILIEVGSVFTTLDEAERATKYLAEVISDIVE